MQCAHSAHQHAKKQGHRHQHRTRQFSKNQNRDKMEIRKKTIFLFAMYMNITSTNNLKIMKN